MWCVVLFFEGEEGGFVSRFYLKLFPDERLAGMEVKRYR